jgi:hypothetical protein
MGAGSHIVASSALYGFYPADGAARAAHRTGLTASFN